MARLLFATFGSYGDLHPYMAIGIEMRNRGHQVTIATHASYEAKVKAERLGFHPVRPDVSLHDRAMMEYVFDARRGTERILSYLAAVARESYEDILPAAADAGLVVTHPITFAAVAAAQKLRKHWVSTVLAPISFLSAYDPPVPAPAPWLAKLRIFGPGVMRRIWDLGRRQSRQWMAPALELRRSLGLDTAAHPLFEGSNSPRAVLALFSRYLAEPQPDWPPNVAITGFPFYDRHHEQQALPPDLRRFLEVGPAPVVFTLGSSAVAAAGNFFRESLQAATRLGARAVFLTGGHPQGFPAKLPPGMFETGYAPHSEVFPRAAAIVHQGGIGTTAQALRSGRPMLVVPFAHDQFDNAYRVRRLGVAEVLYRTSYNRKLAAKHLRRLLEETAYTHTAAALGAQVREENGAAMAADLLERSSA